MAKLGALPAKDIIDAFRGTLDFYTWCSLKIVRKWPRAPGRARAPAVVATQAPFAYINKLAGSLPDNVVESYQELAQDSALSWKDFLNRLYINASIEDTIIGDAQPVRFLNDLDDVHVPSPEHGQLLTWNETPPHWKAV